MDLSVSGAAVLPARKERGRKQHRGMDLSVSGECAWSEVSHPLLPRCWSALRIRPFRVSRNDVSHPLLPRCWSALSNTWRPPRDLAEGIDRAAEQDWCPNCIVPESDHSYLDRVSCRVEVFGVDSVSEDEKHRWEKARRSGSSDMDTNVPEFTFVHRWEKARRSGSRATSGDMSF